MGISMISHVSNAEHIEISTGIPMILTTPTNAPSEGRYSGTQFLRDVESYLTESTNVKKQSSSPRVDYIGEAMYPVYPGYNAVETINTNIDTVNEKNQTASLFSFMVSALKVSSRSFEWNAGCYQPSSLRVLVLFKQIPLCTIFMF